MSGRVAEIRRIIGRNNIAANIGDLYRTWNNQRSEWLSEQEELREFLFATDTKNTTNNALPWKNTTVVPKLCQIRDNLHANYMAALFPNDDWLRWEAYTQDSNLKEKRDAIQAYIGNKARESGFRETISDLLYDYIDSGNPIADVIYVNETRRDPLTGEEIPGYIGPKVVRISPLDHVFNPTAVSYDKSPKITRYIKSVAELMLEAEERPDLNYNRNVLKKLMNVRRELGHYDESDVVKAAGYNVDGFGNLYEYYQSDYVEILEFEGDLFDRETGELLKNKIITVVDRADVLRQEDNPSWISGSLKSKGSWRKRPDTLWAMGPLNNLVGMQYRINHLENAKADALDLMIQPPLKIKGDVEEFDWEPFAEVFLGDDGDIDILKIDSTALNFDSQIVQLELKMEEFAGAPKQAMGFRTPGEKTAFEVQSLENAASRIFQHKIAQFELFMEEILNKMLEVSRRNLNNKDLIRVMDDDLGVESFMEVTRDDITARGKIRPIGARYFAARAQMVQNLTGISNTPIWQQITPHVSSKRLATYVEDMLGWGRFDLVQDNVAIMEQAETQRLINQAQEDLSMEAGISPEEEPPLENI